MSSQPEKVVLEDVGFYLTDAEVVAMLYSAIGNFRKKLNFKSPGLQYKIKIRIEEY